MKQKESTEMVRILKKTQRLVRAIRNENEDFNKELATILPIEIDTLRLKEIGEDFNRRIIRLENLENNAKRIRTIVQDIIAKYLWVNNIISKYPSMNPFPSLGIFLNTLMKTKNVENICEYGYKGE